MGKKKGTTMSGDKDSKPGASGRDSGGADRSLHSLLSAASLASLQQFRAATGRRLGSVPSRKMGRQLLDSRGFAEAVPQPVGYLFPPELGSTIRAIGGLGETYRALGEVGEALRVVRTSPLVDYLASGAVPDLGRLVEASGHATLSVRATGDIRVITASQRALDYEIVRRLECGEPLTALTKAEKSRLSSVLNLLLMFLVYLSTQNAVRSELCFFQPKLLASATASQTGKAVRAFMCEAAAPIEFLRGYRTVKGTGVRLRVAPGMKSDIVPFVLEDRALLEVLDSSNRDWLHVSVVNEAGLEGWISRKYTYVLLR